MNFLGVGAAEAGVILVIALIVIGPQRFPEIMRQAGRWYRIARAYSNEVMKDVRAAVDEIEQEVKAETDDLQSIRDLADLKGDLVEARESMEEIRKDTRAAAATGDDIEGTAGKPGAPEAKPAPAAEPTGSPAADAAPIEPAQPKPAHPEAAEPKPATDVPQKPTPPSESVDPPASHYEGRDPSTYDPFKAKEARDRERTAAREDQGAGEGPSTNGTS